MSGNRHIRFTALKLTWLAAIACAMGVLPGPIRAGSIFDEDFQPPPVAQPKASQPPAESAPAPPVSPAAPDPAVSPAAPSTAPVAESAPVEPVKREIPSKADREKSRALLKEIYGHELADHSPPARKALAGKFLQDAEKSSNAPSDEFVLLGGAIVAAQEASDLPLAFGAADAMAKDFPVDATTLKAQSILKLSTSDFARNREENQRVGLALMDDLETAGDYAQAERVGNVLQQNSTSGADRTSLQQRVKALHDKQLALIHAASALELLKKSPNDPAANLEAGRYFCLMKGDWTRGLPMLAKGSDAAMKALAGKELSATKASGVEIGDAWWDAADREATSLWKPAMQERAIFWYRQVVDGVKGLAKLRIEKRIQSLPGRMGSDAEGQTVLAEAIATNPGILKQPGDAKLLRTHNGTELRGGIHSKLAGSFSDLVNVTNGVINGRGAFEPATASEPIPVGRYLVVFRIQTDVSADTFQQNPICFLQVRRDNEQLIGASAPYPAVLQIGKWSSIAIPLVLQTDEKIQFRVRSYSNHAIAIDRIYLFKAP